MNRKQRRLIAEETVEIQNRGSYRLNGKEVNFQESQRQAEAGSILLGATEIAVAVEKTRPPASGSKAKFSVLNASVVRVVHDLCRKNISPGVLNFASAKNPGGGFLNGSMAQEEALAMASGLYNTQLQNFGYYETNRCSLSPFYETGAIYSPHVPFFRDENYALVSNVNTASVLTMPAVNMHKVHQMRGDIQEAELTMKCRMRMVLAIFSMFGDKNIVLGAYGCGVFRNDPRNVALWWHELLIDEGYERLFDSVTFSVFGDASTISPFFEWFDSC